MEAVARVVTSLGSVTVLIPTVERYPLLEVILGQLRTQTVPPARLWVFSTAMSPVGAMCSTSAPVSAEIGRAHV